MLHLAPLRRLVLGLVLVLGLIQPFVRVTEAQEAAAPGAARVRPEGRRTVVVATRVVSAPVIDGKDDDAVWRTARVVDGFREWNPVEDAAPRFRTTARIAYDRGNLYVFLRAYDPHPDSIVTMLARRDASVPSDEMGVIVDPYHDGRTGYELDVNPSGVKWDASIADDDQSDPAWNAVWDVATRIDSLGWTAEFRIPLPQLGYRVTRHTTFGIAVWRRVERTGEQMSWPLHRRSLPGVISQLGTLTGLNGLRSPRDVEIVPYVVTSNVSGAGGHASGRRVSAGGDLTLSLPPAFRLDATVNPDFGQVEADPSELNLTTFETFFAEHRPFFVDDATHFSAPLNCGSYSCPSENLFYSRRVGRAPELHGVNGNASSPTRTRILGAGKLLGRVGGLTVGALAAATERANGPTGLAVEPAARYGVFRVTEDRRHGESEIGVTATAVNRSLDPSSAPYLHASADAVGLDVRHRFLSQYVLWGSVDVSQVTGSPAAIAATQRDPIHDYQRPDGALTLDTTRTSLTGDDEWLAFDKLGGVVQFEGIYTRRSPGFEINDLGYLRLADQQTVYGWLGLVFNHPTRLYRMLRWNLNTWWWATTAGLVTNRGVNTNAHVTLHNLWRLSAWTSFENLGVTFCDRCARGGPALRQDRMTETYFDVQGDDRNRLVPEVTLRTSSTDGGRSTSFSLLTNVTANVSSRLSASLGTRVGTVHNATQWLGNFTDSAGVTHYAFALLDQRIVGITVRLDYTLSTALSLQAYAQPFASWGTYRDVRELAAPRAADYADRFRPYAPPGGAPAGVRALDLNADVVLRWEYRPGSTLFLVWSQQRGTASDAVGPTGVWDNLRGIFAQPAANTLLLKGSYRLHW